MANPVFEQKRLANRIRMTFGDHALAYRFEDQNAAAEFEQPYADIPFETRVYEEKVGPARAAAIFLLGIAAVGLVGYYFGGPFSVSPVGAAINAGLAGLFEFGYRRSRTSFTVYDAPMGQITVLKDKQHDTINLAIEERRRAAIRSEAVDINLDRPVELELEKYEWLHKHGVITDEEHREKIAALGALQREDGTVPKRLH
ncbi:hypothetical protein [Parvularcula maris]|uniref:Uncharacterized protein n=1 Tax=Parvularcula maris TaxID=2965077 RepID=A0A9X2LAE6_9PROT|nr:hypothetical protein [Parvularcula maris]MCQ8186034.1 hypothetical protein [Parvularcula maris]